MQAIFGSVVLEFIGAFVKWLLNLLVSKMKGTKPVSFRVIWKGRASDSDMDSILEGMSNIFVGVIVLLTVLVVLVAIDFD